MTFGASPLGATPLGASPDERIIKAVYESELLPSDAKQAIKDYVEATFQQTWDTIKELIEIKPPHDLLEWWDLVLDILQQLIQ